MSRRETPIQLPEAQMDNIRRECTRLFQELGFGAYARIDGFVTDDGAHSDQRSEQYFAAPPGIFAFSSGSGNWVEPDSIPHFYSACVRTGALG